MNGRDSCGGACRNLSGYTGKLTPDGERFFGVVDTALAHMGVLCGRSAWNAMGNLGYALHNVPQFIRRPEDFDPGRFQFCFRIAAYNWDEHSPELQRGLCAMMGMDIAAAKQLVRRKGFAINNTAKRPIPFRELKLVGDWKDAED